MIINYKWGTFALCALVSAQTGRKGVKRTPQDKSEGMTRVDNHAPMYFHTAHPCSKKCVDNCSSCRMRSEKMGRERGRGTKNELRKAERLDNIGPQETYSAARNLAV